MATFHTTCRLCLVRCGITVETEEPALPKAVGDGITPRSRPASEIVRFIGNRNHPLSRGYLCVKGKSSVALMDSPNRVIYPQKRVGARGAGKCASPRASRRRSRGEGTMQIGATTADARGY